MTRDKGRVSSILYSVYIVSSPHQRGVLISEGAMYRLQWSWDLGPHEDSVPIREVSSFQRVLCTDFNGAGT